METTSLDGIGTDGVCLSMFWKQRNKTCFACYLSVCLFSIYPSSNSLSILVYVSSYSYFNGFREVNTQQRCNWRSDHSIKTVVKCGASEFNPGTSLCLGNHLCLLSSLSPWEDCTWLYLHIFNVHDTQNVLNELCFWPPYVCSSLSPLQVLLTVLLFPPAVQGRLNIPTAGCSL